VGARASLATEPEQHAGPRGVSARESFSELQWAAISFNRALENGYRRYNRSPS
jgi:hypothetical protein